MRDGIHRKVAVLWANLGAAGNTIQARCDVQWGGGDEDITVAGVTFVHGLNQRREFTPRCRVALPVSSNDRSTRHGRSMGSGVLPIYIPLPPDIVPS